jgi:hypothetical protein
MEDRPWIYDRERQTYVRGPARGGGTFGVLELPSKRFTVHQAVDGVEVAIVPTMLGITSR